MTDEHPPDIDLGAAHLRPARREEARPHGEPRHGSADRVAWEAPPRRGTAAAFAATWWRFVSAPIAAYAAVPTSGGVRRPGAFALLCGAIFGVVSELIDGSTVALIRYGGAGPGLPELLQLDIAGRSLDWLPISVLSAAGCFAALFVGAPLYVLLYSLLVIAWVTILHVLLKITGGLSASEAGYQGTLRAVCYSQVALAGAIVPLIGDPIAVLWSCCLQVPGLARMHGCSRGRAALAVGLPAAGLILALLLVVMLAEPEAAAG